MDCHIINIWQSYLLFCLMHHQASNEVASLVNEQQQAGVYKAEFNANNLPSGIYFARITANEFKQVIKMTLLK
jgi:hypothetical protein